MNLLLALFFATSIMTGTVDQVEGRQVVVELTAKDGHMHNTVLPLWLFPCRIEEGSKFWIEMKDDSLTIFCGEK